MFLLSPCFFERAHALFGDRANVRRCGMSQHPMSVEDLIRVPRISAAAPCPTGGCVAYVKASHDAQKNRVRRTVMVTDLQTGTEREITPGEHNDEAPAWSPDGSMLAFVSDRAFGKQVWVLPFAHGGEARRITDGPGGAAQPVWAPDSRRIAVSRSLSEPETDQSSQNLEDSEREQTVRAEVFGLSNSKSTARIADGLLFRHWNSWRDGKRNRVYVIDTETGESEAVTPAEMDVPPISLGGSQDFVFSPSGDEIAFVANPDERVAVSTNNSVFVQKLDGVHPAGEARCISVTEASDCEPRYSPDGVYIAYLGAEQPRYEADRMRVKIFDRNTEQTANLTEFFDRSAAELAWRNDSEILFLAADRGYTSLYGVEVGSASGSDPAGAEAARAASASAGEAQATGAATDAGAGEVYQYTSGVNQSGLRLMSDAELVLTRSTVHDPPDLFLLTVPSRRTPELSNGSGAPARFDGTARRLTAASEALSEVKQTELESFWYAGADDDPVHGFLMKPPGFDPSAAYPLLLLIHGGPQSAFFDQFHFRWNAAVFAGAGFVVAMVNPRGSIGYGQRFTDQISGDWGGRCYEDVMRGVDYLLAAYDWIDENRLAAAGGSFGGYMVNWIAGHSERFRVLVSHDGIFNQESMSYTTDELWFDIWEHGGMPYELPEQFRRQSPHVVADRMNTPMLVIQGGLDYRCPVGEGISLFTALQSREVPSRLLYFEDEGHFVTQPANAEVWYKTVIDFVKQYV